MTTAITLALAVIAGTALYAWWAIGALAGGLNPLWIAIGVPIAFFAIPVVLSVIYFTVSWIFRSPRPEDVTLGPRGLVRLYLHEVLAVAGSIPRMIFYRSLMPDPPPARNDYPVLLLHGVLCNAGVWSPMARYLKARGVGPIYALSYGPPLASIETFALQAAAKIDAILAATGAKQVIIVAHSMGGLVSRTYIRRFGSDKVARLITIGTPHRGSLFAHAFPGRSLAQMRPRNAWLADLADDQPDGDATAAVPIVSLWSWHDSMVVPQRSSVLEGATNVALFGIGHNALLGDPLVFERVAAEIERAIEGRAPSPVATETADERIAAR